MTMKEIEELSEIPRATIRFYEKEGLIHPAREENGYRDYSEEDLLELKKIKLLRQLQMTVEVISDIQKGHLELQEAMRQQAEELENQLADRETAKEICETIRRNWVNYQDLKPEPYLEQIKSREQSSESQKRQLEGRSDEKSGAVASFFRILEQDSLPIVPHPWRRCFARDIDLMMYLTIWKAVQCLVLHISPYPMYDSGIGWDAFFGERILQMSFGKNLLVTYIGYGMMLLVEPVFLSLFGTTPGKWIFGLRVSNRNGGHLTWKEAFSRTWQVFVYGIGCGIPIFSLWRQIRSYQACRDGEQAVWEELRDYQIRDTRGWRGFAYIMISLAITVVQFFVVLEGGRPHYQGNVTPEQYIANCNQLMDWYGMELGGRLREDGSWEKPPEDPNTFVISIMKPCWMDFQLQLTDGYVTGVKLERTENTAEQIVPNDRQEMVAAVALLGSQEGMSGFDLWKAFLPRQMSQVFRQDGEYSLNCNGLHLYRKIEAAGYQCLGSFYMPIEGTKEYNYHLEFLVEKDKPAE